MRAAVTVVPGEMWFAASVAVWMFWTLPAFWTLAQTFSIVRAIRVWVPF